MPPTRGRGNPIVATDGELLMRFARHGDHRAFSQIVERHGGLVWVVCREVLRHHQDVEDAFQATFFILAERAATIRSSDSAAAWLYKVAQRTSLAARRQRSRRREEELANEPPQGEEALPMLHDRQMMFVLMEELRGLPERYQVPLVLRYLEGQSRRAIAEQTDLTISQIQGRLVRGRRLLRSRMVRRGVSLSLAAGAMTSASAQAGAALTPALAAATAKSCLALKTTGAALGASPAALQLAKQGVKAMWLTSMMKTAAAVSTVLVAAGIAWAVQAGGQSGSGAAGASTAPGVEIQAVAAPADQTAEASTVKIESDSSASRPATTAAAPPSTVGGTATRDAQTVKLPASDPRVRIADIITELQSVISKNIDDKAEARARLEWQEVEKSLLRRVLEAAHSKLMELSLSPNQDGSEEAQKKRNEHVRMAADQIETTKDKLSNAILKAAQMSAELERIELRMSGVRQNLEEMQRMQIQMEFAPPENEQRRGTVSGDGTTDKLPMVTPQKSDSHPTPASVDGKLEPQDKLFIRVANAFADAPIDGMYTVESMGTVALGPTYGRVEVKGLTLLEAEDAIKKQLAKLIEDPAVQVTMSEKESSVRELEQLHRAIDALQTENAALKQQLGQLKGSAPVAPGTGLPGLGIYDPVPVPARVK